jgi:hypothetical protein
MSVSPKVETGAEIRVWPVRGIHKVTALVSLFASAVILILAENGNHVVNRAGIERHGLHGPKKNEGHLGKGRWENIIITPEKR